MSGPILNKYRIVTGLGGLAVTACGIVASLAIGIGGLDLTASSERQPNFASVPNRFEDVGPELRCDEREPSPVGLLGRLSPGSTVESLLAAGFEGVQAIDGGESILSSSALRRALSRMGQPSPTSFGIIQP